MKYLPFIGLVIYSEFVICRLNFTSTSFTLNILISTYSLLILGPLQDIYVHGSIKGYMEQLVRTPIQFTKVLCLLLVKNSCLTRLHIWSRRWIVSIWCNELNMCHPSNRWLSFKINLYFSTYSNVQSQC